MKFIKYLSDVTIEDISLVGGKNAALGQMIQYLTKQNINIPLGFAITVKAYWYFLEYNNILLPIKQEIGRLKNIRNIKSLQLIGSKIRNLIYNGQFPEDLIEEIKEAYIWLSKAYKQENIDVAIRSSATAEDLPHASFAGQQDTFLNIKGIENVLDSIKRCIASLFTDRAIIYRNEHKFDHLKVGIAVGVQKMIRSDRGSSGVVFTLDTDTGFKDVIVINSSYGLGENIVKGIINPDEFHVHKPTLKQGFKPIIKKYLGNKQKKLIYTHNIKKPVKNISVSLKDRSNFSLSDEEILSLAKDTIKIEEYFSELHGKSFPLDIEWAKDGIDNQIYILQARPETVHSHKKIDDILERYHLNENNKLNIIAKGLSIGQKIASGKARILKDISQASKFKKGDILITTMTDPDWVPLMKKASAIITDQGGRTCHAAIVSRELGIPAIVGTSNATKKIKNSKLITVDCSKGATGYIYEDKQEFTIEKIRLKELPKSPVPILLNIADPDKAYELSYLPVQGIGLARIEFIITNFIKVHPMAICKPKAIKDKKLLNKIKLLSYAYNNLSDFFVQSLAQGIATIAAAFYPKEVIVRFSDFKSNEYKNLLGGKYFEPDEENPMLGFRGAVRYCSENYAPAFALECKAIKKAREEMGFTNIKVMIPFVRTLKEAKCTIKALEQNSLKRSENNLKIYMMCEIPSNVILLEKFSKLFDGFSIGSNDLTQLTLGVDRDSAMLSKLFDERDTAVTKMLEIAIKKAHKTKSYITICGQAPSDFHEIAEFLIKAGIDAVSLNADSVIPFLLKIKKIH